MGEKEIANGQLFIFYDELAGYQAPREFVYRPVRWSENERIANLHGYTKHYTDRVQAEIPVGIRTIGKKAFERCYVLSGVALPDTVEKIEEGAFRDCTALTGIRIPDNVKKIGTEAFAGCTVLTNLSLPAHLEMIESKAFLNCSALTQIHIPDSVTSIGTLALGGCIGLREITLPAQLCGEAGRIFGDVAPLSLRFLSGTLKVNQALEAVLKTDLKRRRQTVAKGIVAARDVETMERFLMLWDKVSLDFLEHLIEMSIQAQAVGITAMLMQRKNTLYPPDVVETTEQLRMEEALGGYSRTAAEWGQIFDFQEEDGKLVIIGYKQREAVVEVPAEIDGKPVVAVDRWTPKGRRQQKEPFTVFLPEGLEEIRNFAFSRSHLKYIRIARSVTKIGAYAFSGCEYLESLCIPSGVKCIENGICSNCTALQSVSIPESVMYINTDAFSNCDSLNLLALPAHVTEIREHKSDER